ncbi:MAG TPA: GNAT family N-acetyltransferase [Thermomicrobiales bacterium]|nr:GNAT family N-acetyltransferase [Thermomicrobiales bacterium]
MAMHLEGSRIVLREFVGDDWAAVQAWASRPEVCRYQAWGPNTPAESRVHVERVLQAAAWQPRRDYTLAAALRTDGRVIGSGALHLRNERFRTGEIAYVVHPDHWGRGLATEIATLLLRRGFEEFHLHRIYATCDPRNAGSGRVLQKIGMVHEGRLRHTMLIRDGWRDSDVYGIVEHEWLAAASRPCPVGEA